MQRHSKFSKLMIFVLIAVLSLTAFVGCSQPTAQVHHTVMVDSAIEESVTKTPKYIFFMIGDGLGAPQREITEFYLRQMTGNPSANLFMNTLDYAGMTRTYSYDTLVTDSAASGTALATGHKTNNDMIGQAPDGSNLKNLVEAAQEKGLATGLISTTRITHATPASFGAHVDHRDKENEIAEQYVESNIDFFAGGGLRHFVPQNSTLVSSKREDNRDLLKEFEARGYSVFTSAEEMRDPARAIREQDKVVALPTSSHVPYEIDRLNSKQDAVSLVEMVDIGIEVLSKKPNGFFMMIEGGRIDHAAHAHDPAGVIYDTLAFDEAVKRVYDFYLEHPDETLIVVGGDHETGGLGLGIKRNYFLNLEVLDDAKASIEDATKAAYVGDREAYFEFIAENLGLDDLTREEKEAIIKAMDLEDSIPGKKGEKKYDIHMWGYNGPVEMTTANILSERAAISWTTYAHSGSAIPLTAHGVGAENFTKFLENVDVPKIIAEIAGFDLGH